MCIRSYSSQCTCIRPLRMCCVRQAPILLHSYNQSVSRPTPQRRREPRSVEIVLVRRITVGIRYERLAIVRVSLKHTHAVVVLPCIIRFAVWVWRGVRALRPSRCCWHRNLEEKELDLHRCTHCRPMRLGRGGRYRGGGKVNSSTNKHTQTGAVPFSRRQGGCATKSRECCRNARVSSLWRK